MAFGNDIGLLFRISSDSKDAQSDIKRLRETYDKELKSIKASANDSKIALGRAFGFSSVETAQFESTIKRTASQLAVVTGATVAVGAGIFSLVKQSADLGSKFFDLSQKTAVSVETLSSLRVAADKSGTSIEELSVGLVRFVNQLGEAEKGDEKMIATLNELGITTFKDTESALSQFTKRLSELGTQEEKVQAASEAFGKRSGAALVAMFDEVGGDLDAFKSKMKDLGFQMSGDTAQQADKLGDRLTELGLRAEGLAVSVGNSLTPAFTQLIESFERTGEAGKSSFDSIDFTIGNVIRGIAALKNDIDTLGDFLKGNITLDDAVFGRGTREYVLGRGDPNAIPQVDVPGLGTPLKRPGAGPSKEQSEEARQIAAEQKKAEAEAEAAQKAALAARSTNLSTALERDRRTYQTNLDRLKEARDADLISEEEYANGVIAAEDYLLRRVRSNTQGQVDLLEEQEKDANLRSARRAKLLDDLVAVEVEHDKKIRAAKSGAAKVEKEDLQEQIKDLMRRRDTMLKVIGDFANRSAATNRDFAARNVITNEEAEERIKKIRLDALDTHINILIEDRNAAVAGSSEQQRLQDEILARLSERAAAEEESFRLIDEARKKDMESAQARKDFVSQIMEEEAAEIDADIKRRLEQEAAKRSATTFGGFAGALGLDINLENTAVNSAKIVSDAWMKAGGMVGGAVKGMAQGFGSLVQQWVLLGELGPNAVRKMVASVLAGLAAEAAVEALMELARGLAALSNPFTAWQAPGHFAAAKVFAIVAGTAAIAGRVVAGNSFAGSATDAQGVPNQSRLAEGDRPAGPQAVSRIEDRRQPQVIVVQHEHVMRMPNGFVVAELESANQTNNPRLNKVMRNLTQRFA